MLFAKKAKFAVKSDLYRKFLARKILKELPKAAKDQWDDFDVDDVLRYVGLTTYKPARSSFAGVGAFIIGCAVGGIAALMLAPVAIPSSTRIATRPSTSSGARAPR